MNVHIPDAAELAYWYGPERPRPRRGPAAPLSVRDELAEHAAPDAAEADDTDTEAGAAPGA